MDRSGRLAALCLVLLVGLVPVLPTSGAWLPAKQVAALGLALLGGAALLAEARRGIARPGLGTPVDAAFGLWLLFSLLSAIDAERPAIARYELGRLLTLGLAYLLAIRTLTTPARVRRLLLACVASASLIATLGLIGYAEFVESGAPESSRSALLATPFFGHSYLAVQFVLLPLLAGLLLALERGRPWGRRLALIAMLAPVAAYLTVTGSRGALLAVGAALFVSALLRLGAREAGGHLAGRLARVAGKGLVVLLLAAGVLAALSQTGFLAGAAQSVAERFSAWLDVRQAHTSFSRLAVWQAGLQIAGEHPLFGAGPGSFGMLAAGRLDTAVSVPHAHNQFVQTFAENGLLACFALLALLRATRQVAVRGSVLMAPDNARRGLFHALVAALVGALVSACFETPLIWTESGCLIVVLLAAVSRSGCDSRERVASLRAQTSALGLVLVLLIAAAPTWWRLVPALSSGSAAQVAFRTAEQRPLKQRTPATSEASAAYERVVEANARFAEHPRLSVLAATLATRLGRLDDALSWHERTLEMMPGALRQLAEKGRLLLLLDRPEEAYECLSTALSRWGREDRGPLLHAVARAALATGRLEQAWWCFERLFDLRWHHAQPEALRDAAQVLLWLEREPQHALSLLDDYTARRPLDAEQTRLAELRAELEALAARLATSG